MSVDLDELYPFTQYRWIERRWPAGRGLGRLVHREGILAVVGGATRRRSCG